MRRQAFPRWRWPEPPTLSFKTTLQKPIGDVTVATSIFFLQSMLSSPPLHHQLVFSQIKHFPLTPHIFSIRFIHPAEAETGSEINNIASVDQHDEKFGKVFVLRDKGKVIKFWSAAADLVCPVMIFSLH